ncbi:hypothetical protein LIER_37052 [Lithospermum erythrorhizon]|uniref:Reverse transcriptase domain-containing protein n=1 Tax=Lithospermum erythrorhizon TaxID=34254 RepID=A0AAV3PH84_LITER
MAEKGRGKRPMEDTRRRSPLSQRDGVPSTGSEHPTERTRGPIFREGGLLTPPIRSEEEKGEDKKMMRRPPRYKTPQKKRDISKFCQYHNDHGHDTNDCRHLKIKIEKLIQRGQLRVSSPGDSKHEHML